ncbi:hypothetical protein RND81_02G082600 [Saponaria officinalis]|uniref:AIPP2-like SPOC-like domain-containing protein n=2 Tax=Saponaria officinalis TaxID=3572 RepID=A0AAW1MNH8_SAPOF
MVKICQTCGEIGFTKALIFCTNCWDTAEHTYCLGLSPRDIKGSFSWNCGSCAMKCKQRVGIVIYGDQVDKTTKAFHRSRVSEQRVSGVPVVGPIWRGEVEIDGSFIDRLDAVEIFMPKTSYSNVVKVKCSMQTSICFSMQDRHALWPKHFDEVGATHNDIDLFLFPEISRSEAAYDNLVELMIANDLAMSSRIGNLELIIFTSLEQENNQQQIQGKYYLWGIIKGKGFRRNKLPKGKKKSEMRIHSPLSRKIALNAARQLITTTRSLANCDFIPPLSIPPLSQGCKRARSKKRRISTTVNKESDIRKAVMADFPGKEKTDQPNNGCVSVKWQQTHDRLSQDKICVISEQIQQVKSVQVENVCGITVEKKKPDEVDNLFKEDVITKTIGVDDMKDDPTTIAGACGVEDRLTNQDSPTVDFIGKIATKNETKEAERHSWDSNMEIDEPSDTFGTRAEKTNFVENPRWDSDMEIDVPTDDVVEGLTVAAPMVTTDVQNRSCLTSLRDKEESDVSQTNLPAYGEINSCLDEKALGNRFDSVDGDHQNITANTLPGIPEISAGLYQGAVRVQQPECQVSDLLPEKDSLLDFKEPRPSTSSTDTVVLEIEEDEDEEETTMKRFPIFNDKSDTATTSSGLRLSNDFHFHESSSDTFRVQVGRYAIRSDLAPILTKILDKHGDIASDCSIMPEILLEDICEAFQDIEPVPFSGLRSHHLDRLRNLCQLGEALKFDIKWLAKRCDNLEKTALQLSQYRDLKGQMTQCNKSIQSLEKKVKATRDTVANLLDENQSLEEEFESLKERRRNMHFEVESVRSESRRFLSKLLVDGLF